MKIERGREVYVFFEGVFALDESVDTGTSGWVTVRTPSGVRVDLPVEAVAEWDVEAAAGPQAVPRLTVESLHTSASTGREASITLARRLRRV